MSSRFPKTPLPTASWVLLCAYLNCAGWILSALHKLDRTGYTVALVSGALLAFIWWRWCRPGGMAAFQPTKLVRRFRRPFARAFLVLGGMAFLGGVLHAPNNYDDLAYRTPRILNWLADGQWHWIHTIFQRLNTRICGNEWVTAPLILFSGTDRIEFLINTASFLLLPGLIFSVFRRVGVKPRVAWHWMWILPTGYSFLLQVGGSANDMFGVVFVLAAVDFALRARQTGRMGEVWLSVLAAAMFTSSKTSNLPLLLPWLVAFLFAWRAWWWRPVAVGIVVFPAMLASFLPTAIMNQRHGGDWTGERIESISIGGGPAWLHLFNNTVNYSLEELSPPVFPLAGAWNRFMDRSMSERLRSTLARYFETNAADWHVGELRSEESAGLGVGVISLLLASLVASRFAQTKKPSAPPDWTRQMLLLAPWVSLLVLMCKMSLAGGTRYLVAYYPLLFMGLLQGSSQAEIILRKWWRIWAGVGFVLAALLLVVSQARPLWPEEWFFARYGSRLGTSASVQRLMKVYSVYGERANVFAPAVARFPADATLIGIVTSDDPETSLWRPFGSRKIVHVLPKEPADEIRRRGIHYVFVKVDQLEEPWTDWLPRVNARLLWSVDLPLRASAPLSEWRFVELN